MWSPLPVFCAPLFLLAWCLGFLEQALRGMSQPGGASLRQSCTSSTDSLMKWMENRLARLVIHLLWVWCSIMGVIRLRPHLCAWWCQKCCRLEMDRSLCGCFSESLSSFISLRSKNITSVDFSWDRLMESLMDQLWSSVSSCWQAS